MSDPAAWPSARLRDEVAFALSPIGRQRREDREVAFALEIQRLETENARLRGAMRRIENINNGPDLASGDWRCREAAAIARAALAGKEG